MANGLLFLGALALLVAASGEPSALVFVVVLGITPAAVLGGVAGVLFAAVDEAILAAARRLARPDEDARA